MRTVTHIAAESVPIPPPGWGAVEKWVVEIASRINKRYKVKIISIPSTNSTTIPNTEFIYLSGVCSLFRSLSNFEKLYIKKYLGVSPVRSYLNKKGLPSWSYAHYLKKELGNHETDIFHFHQRPDYIHMTKPKKPVIIHLHNKIPGLTPNFPLFPSFFKGIERAEMVITVSKELRDYFVKEGVDKKKIEVLYNGVDVKKYHPGKKVPGIKLIFVGKLIKRKGVVDLLKAFKTVRKELPEAELYIIGRKDEKSDYFKEVQKYITEGVKFTDVVSEEELIRHYRDATLLVHPPLYEAFGMTLIESMSSGTPVVATKVGGIPEVVGDKGILTEPNNPENLAKSIIKALDDKKKYAALVKDSRKRVEENFSWDIVSKRLMSLYEKL